MDSATVIILLAAVVFGVSVQLYFTPPYDRDILVTTARDEYDYIVVGGGSAGSVVAARLSEDPYHTVLLLEAGGFYDDPVLHVPSEFFPLLMSKKHAWDYYTESQTHSSLGMNERQGFWPRGRVLGGTHMINAMKYTRGSRFDFDEWAAGGCTGWGYKYVLPYFLKSEDMQIAELKTSPYHSSGGPLAVTSGIVTELGPLLLKAGNEEYALP